MTSNPPRRKLSAILMVDVSGFSRMMGRDEERTTVLIREFHERTKGLVESHQGRVVDTAGDSVFGEFDSVIQAVQCAQAIQEAQSLANASRAPGERIETRIGVHLGDVIVQDYNVYGDGVNIAARLEPIADPGGICISEAVYQLVRDRLDTPVQDLGLRELKNIQYPVRVFKIPPLEPKSSGSEVTTQRADGAAPTPSVSTSPNPVRPSGTAEPVEPVPLILTPEAVMSRVPTVPSPSPIPQIPSTPPAEAERD